MLEVLPDAGEVAAKRSEGQGFQDLLPDQGSRPGMTHKPMDRGITRPSLDLKLEENPTDEELVALNSKAFEHF